VVELSSKLESSDSSYAYAGAAERIHALGFSDRERVAQQLLPPRFRHLGRMPVLDLRHRSPLDEPIRDRRDCLPTPRHGRGHIVVPDLDTWGFAR
jgi:hypothetical protein